MYDRSLSWMQGTEIDEGTRLRVWQERRDRSDSEYSAEEAEMDIRERKYNGDNKLSPLTPGDTKKDGSPKKRRSSSTGCVTRWTAFPSRR